MDWLAIEFHLRTNLLSIKIKHKQESAYERISYIARVFLSQSSSPPNAFCHSFRSPFPSAKMTRIRRSRLSGGGSRNGEQTRKMGQGARTSWRPLSLI